MRLSGIVKAYCIIASKDTFLVAKLPSLSELTICERSCGAGSCSLIAATSNAGGSSLVWATAYIAQATNNFTSPMGSLYG